MLVIFPSSLPKLSEVCQAVEKLSVHPSTGLRANGGSHEIIHNFPFMLSSSKHTNHFFNSLFMPDPFPPSVQDNS